MKKTVLVVVATLAMLIACVQQTDKGSQEGLRFDQVLEEYYLEGLPFKPVQATFRGISAHNNLFPDYLSESYQTNLKNYYTTYASLLNEFKNEALSKEQLISKKLIIRDCNIGLEGFNYYQNYFPIDQMFSLQLKMGQLASTKSAQPFKTVQDYENWYSRLEGYVTWLESSYNKMNEGIHKGYVHPRAIIRKMIPQFETMANTPLKEHLFFSPVKNFPVTFTADEKTAFETKYVTLLQDKFIPSHKKMLDFLQSDYLNAGRETSGIGELEGGQDWYKYRIKLFTATNMSADEIHDLGLKEVERILAEMIKVKDALGFEGDLKAFFNHVRTSEELMPYDDPQQVIDQFNTIYETMEPQLALLFDKTPKTRFMVKRTETFREKSASAQYNRGSLKEGRPGIFYVPIPNVKEYNVFTDEALFLHEAIPGHHYQIALTQENEQLPDFRKIYWDNAYGEGWALYTESLGRELGLYTDLYQYFGMLGAEMHRAIRLVVDTGIHTKGWTREQAIQYSLDHEAESKASITSEVERYMANPGQALGYKIGQLKIRELRKQAESQLGDKFDIKDFHNVVLESGCITLDILEWKVNQWVEARLG